MKLRSDSPSWPESGDVLASTQGHVLNISLLILVLAVTASGNLAAHPGGTDSFGCHHCRTNCSSWGLADGEYHCHGSVGSTCFVHTINCNSTVTSELQTTDCDLDDDTFIDFWFFDGFAGQRVMADLESNDFNTFLFLIDPNTNPVEFDDNGGNGTNSRIVFELDSSGQWVLGVNNLLPLSGNPGDYSLTLSCSDGPSDSCTSEETVLCLRGRRFRIESGREGSAGYLPGVVVFESEGSAVMRYSAPNKWELMVNVQPRAGRYWFSATGLTEGREYDISVEDVSTGQSWTFTLPESNPRVTNSPLSFIE